MMWLLFMLLLFPNRTAHNNLLELGSVCPKCSMIYFRFRGRYLSRRIAYPSNGSFNPFVISNKEAHIVNGNINSEVLEEKRNAICNSTDSNSTYMCEGSNACNQRAIVGAVDVVREPIWSLIRGRCPSFSSMTANAVFSDIFTMQAFGDLTSDLKSLFLIQQCNQTCCTLCNNQILKTTSTIVLYITCPNILPTEFEN
ncbi:hypothetical protein pdam_00026025, partial [Pocillopora damicornis]